MAQTEAQKRATAKYRAKNKEKTKRDWYKNVARTFIKKYATEEEMKELNKIFNEKPTN